MSGKVGMKKGVQSNLCSKCKNKKDGKNKRYCKKCHSSYMKKWRKNNPLTKIQRFKNTVRRKTNMKIKRGLLIKYPCEICGIEKTEAHHDDYSKPYNIRWLCKKHHLEHHKEERKIKKELSNANAAA